MSNLKHVAAVALGALAIPAAFANGDSLVADQAGVRARTAAATSATVSAPEPTEDLGTALYRRAVLGDTSVAVPSTVKPADSGRRLLPGSYAMYLMYLGVLKERALAQAESMGELPRLVVNTDPLAPYSWAELYQRRVLGASDSDIRFGRAASSQGGRERVDNVRNVSR